MGWDPTNARQNLAYRATPSQDIIAAGTKSDLDVEKKPAINRSCRVFNRIQARFCLLWRMSFTDSCERK